MNTTNTTKRAIGYIRVSSDIQVKGTSLAQQRRDITAYCRDHKIELVRIIEDGGVTGSKEIAERPGMRELLLLAGQNQFDAVIVTRLDRFSRDLFQALWAEKQLLVHGIPVTAIQQDTGNMPEEMARAFRSIMLTFAELDKSMTVKKMSNGKAAKFKSNPVGPSAGRVSYGYRTDGPRGARELVPDPEEQQGLKKMRTMQQGGFGYERIAAALNGEIVYRGQDMTHTARGGGQWSPGMVRRAMNSNHGQGKIKFQGTVKRVRK